MRPYVRLPVILATAAAVALVLSACGSDNTATAPGSAGSAGSSDASAASTASAGSAEASAVTSAESVGPSGSGGSAESGGGQKVTLSIATNGISGGKNAQEADWITNYVIPQFTKAQAAKGVTVEVSYQSSGVDDEKYKAKLALDLKAGSGPDVFSIDGIWVGEFAQAGYIKPLEEEVGADYKNWDGWKQIPQAVQANATFAGKLYALPTGTDGRVLFYNKTLFAKAVCAPTGSRPAGTTSPRRRRSSRRSTASPAADPGPAQAGTTAQGRADRWWSGARGTDGPSAGSTVRRPATAGGAGQGDGLPAIGIPVRRTTVQPDYGWKHAPF